MTADIKCPACKTINTSDSKFCKNCGKGLLDQENVEQEDKVVLNNDFLMALQDIYQKKLLKRIEQSNDAVDIHSAAVRLLDSSNLKKEYSFLVKKCFGYLIDSSEKILSKKHIEYIKKKRDIFLSDDSKLLFLLLNDLYEKAAVVLENVSISSEELSNVVNGDLKSVTDYLAGGDAGGVSATTAASSEVDKIKKMEQNILLDFNNVKESVAGEFDIMWEKLCKLFDEIEENTPIRFEVDQVALEEQMEEEGKIARIIESNLGIKDLGFYFYSNIPAEKKAIAKSSYLNTAEGEQLVCLYDSTLFGGAKKGICLSTKGIYWKCFRKDRYFCHYDAIEETKIDKDGYLKINEWGISTNTTLAKSLKKTLDEIVAYLKSRKQ
jgi:hypothetical protein